MENSVQDGTNIFKHGKLADIHKKTTENVGASYKLQLITPESEIISPF